MTDSSPSTLENIAEELGMPAPVLLAFAQREDFPKPESSSSRNRLKHKYSHDEVVEWVRDHGPQSMSEEELDATLWKSADQLYGSMDAASYKHIVLGLVFLKYVSDEYTALRDALRALPEYQYDWDDPDYYLANNVLFMQEDSLWQNIVESPRDNRVGERIDQAFREIEKDNEKLRKKLPSGQYSKEEVDQRRLGQLVDLIDTLQLGMGGIGARDIMGRVFEYFLGKFAIAEGQRGGQYYTPTSVVDLLVEIIEPYSGRIYDPCCGSGGMFVHSSKFVREHGGKTDDIVVYGQELTNTTWKLASMSLVTRGIGHDLGERAADTFFDDQHPALKANYVLANPPFNINDWGAEELAAKEGLWPYGPPTDSNANYAWIQLILRKLARGGRAGIVLAAGSLTDNNSGQKEVRQAFLRAGVVEAIVALPDRLFHNTPLAPVLWILKQKDSSTPEPSKVKVLFVDARDQGRMVSRTLRVLSSEEQKRIADAVNSFRGDKDKGDYEDEPGFCYSASLEEIEEQDWALTPGRYVGVVEDEEDDEAFWERYRDLHSDLKKSLKESAELEKKVVKGLGGVSE